MGPIISTSKELPRRDVPPIFLQTFYLSLALIVTWFAAFVEPTGMLFLLLVPSLLGMWLAKRRWVTAATYGLLLPTTFIMGVAAVDYAHGSVRLRFSGLPGTEFYNINPVYRCEHGTYGCLVSGGEWITQLPYNLTACALIRTFGYMPGSYDGPYPNEQEALAAVSNGVDVEWKSLESDTASIGNEVTRMDEGTGKRLLLSSPRHFYDPEDSPRRAVKGAIWRQRCLILSIPTSFSSEKESAMIVVLDRQNGRPFAYYSLGDYYHRSPPVEWKKEVASR